MKLNFIFRSKTPLHLLHSEQRLAFIPFFGGVWGGQETYNEQLLNTTVYQTTYDQSY